jgi:hypothetical protein
MRSTHEIRNHFYSNNEKTKLVCNICEQSYNYKTSISNLKKHFEKYHNEDYKLIIKKNIEKTHPILNYYSLGKEKGFICKLCSKEYKSYFFDTLKRYFARNHKNVWDKIKKEFK